MERYKLTFTMIARISQIHQHWTLHKRICCCWTTASLVSRIKPKRTTPMVDTTIAIRYTLLKTISDYLDKQFEKIQTLLSFSHKTRRISHIHADHCAKYISLLEFKQFCHVVWSKEHNFVTIDLTSTPTNGKFHQNFNLFYFPTGAI